LEKSENIPIVDVCGKRMLDYIIETMGKFNRGASEVTLTAIGRNISRGVEVVQILTTTGYNIEISSMDIKTIEVDYQGKYSCLEVTLKCDNKAGGSDKISMKRDSSKRDFIEYPIYHLLIDSLLHTSDQLDILRFDGSKLININKSGWEFECRVDRTLNVRPDDESNAFNSKLAEAYYRCGLLVSPVWEKVAKKLSDTDDIIIGVDTCMLYDAALTEQLLNSLSIIGSRKHFHTPNWLLIVVPSAVMQELERSANIRDNKGFLGFAGRMGFRALQEILELNRAKDLSGISLIIVGESNPVLDTRLELQALRTDLFYNIQNMFRRVQKLEADDKKVRDDERSIQSSGIKLSTGDMIIRDQFKQFLRQIDFHKGMYFLTSDKSNAALAQTEGLQSIYYTKPPAYLIKESAERPIRPKRIRYKVSNRKQSGEIIFGVPLGKLIYELAVGFGTINVRYNNEEIKIRCDGKGESLDYWLFKDLMIRHEDLQKLLNNYEKVGKFSLDKIKDLWDDINRPAK
jgi:DNA-binding protein Alba